MSLAAALLLTAPWFAETAMSREGSAKGNRAVGARHHSPSASSGQSRHAPPTAVSRSGSSVGDPSGAQSRHPRAGTGHGPRHHYYGYGGWPYYYPYGAYWGYGGYPYFGFYGSWGYGYYGAPYYGGGYYGSPHYGHDAGSVRVLVDPSETRVFVDGSYAGTADEFDGLFQRLHITPGRHEIALKLEGYRSHRMRVYVPYDGTLKLHHDMVEGSGEDAVEDLVGDRYAAEERAERSRDRHWQDEDGAVAGEARREPRFETPASDTGSATLRLQVRPQGASIYVDGEFRGTGGSLSYLELAAGSHRIEILHPGLRTFTRDVTLDAGESQDLELELTE
jgi:hypothetical protein